MKNYAALSVLGAVLLACSEGGPREIPPLPLPVVTLAEQDVSLEIEFVGQVYGYLDIPIRARVDGYLQELHFQEGTPVREGQLLYSIDAQPFREQVAQQQSALAQSKTNLAKAQSDYDRVKPLAEIRAVSQAELDGATAALDAAKASVTAAEASLRLSQINLGYTRIASPISGIIGKSLAQRGEYVGQSPNPVILNTVSKTDSLKVEFFLTENDYLQLARQSLISDQEEEEGIPKPDINLILSDNSVFDYPGKFRFINREVDPTTGAILVQTIFPNPRNLIKPGQFAKVRITTPPLENTIVVPQRAVREFQGQFSVFVLGDSNKVKETPVELGETYRDYYVVRNGLSDGDQVLLEGLLKVRSGQVIDPQMTEFESKVPQ